MNTARQRECGVCGEPAILRSGAQEGYVAPQQFEIWECQHCGTAFAIPLQEDATVYDLIYRHGRRVPGYDRYYRYADEVACSADPLSYLAAQEANYGAIASVVRDLVGSRRVPLRILEMGCGMGYLTHALACAGHLATGLDVSKEAIRSASVRFRGEFVCADVFAYAREHRERLFDCVVGCEVIEHVSDPYRLLSVAKSLIVHEGVILITTPNRSFYAESVLWEVDPPPVHLWWFSEEGMRAFGSRLGMRCSLFDFTQYHQNHEVYYQARVPPSRPTRRSVFSKEGALLRSAPSSAGLAVRDGVWRVCTAIGMRGMFKRLQQWRHGCVRGHGARSTSLCAVFSRE